MLFRSFTVLAGPNQLPLDLGCGWLHGGRDNAWYVIAARTGLAIDHTRSSWDGGGRSLGLDTRDKRAADEATAAFFERAEARNTDSADVALSTLLQPGCRWNGLIGAIGTFINGVELEDASLRDYQRYHPGRGPDPRVTDGYGHLIESYGSGLPVTLDTTVTCIDHSGTSISLSTSRGTLAARVAIVTVPTGVLAKEELSFQPALPAKSAAAGSLPLGLANKLFLAIPNAIDLPSEHHVIGTAERLETAGYHVRPFGRPIIECYFGGQLARNLEQEGQGATVAFAKAELGRHFGHAVADRLEPLRASAWASMPHIKGSYSYARPGASGARADLAAPVDNRLFFAGEACSPHRFSTAHGAYETGVVAAEAVAAAFGKLARSSSVRVKITGQVRAD